MEAHPAHKSLPLKAKIEAMDVLMSAWTGNNGFYPPARAPLLTFFYRASPSVPSYCSCPFHSGRMPRIDDTYSMLWRYPDPSLFLQQIYLYETTDDLDDLDDHGIETRIVSRVLLRVG